MLEHHEDVYQLGFESSFEKHERLRLDNFCKKFNQFIVDNSISSINFSQTKPLKVLVDVYSINLG